MEHISSWRKKRKEKHKLEASLGNSTERPASLAASHSYSIGSSQQNVSNAISSDSVQNDKQPRHASESSKGKDGQLHPLVEGLRIDTPDEVFSEEKLQDELLIRVTQVPSNIKDETSTNVEPSDEDIDDPAGPRDRWRDAYSSLKIKNPKLVSNYEKIIATMEQPGVLASERKRWSMMDIVTKKVEEMEKGKWHVNLGGGPIEVRKQVDRVLKIVNFAKLFVTTAVSPSPHAAMAWAGVCVLLPLLLNSGLQNQAHLEGLSEVSAILSRYNLAETTYFAEDGKKSVVEDKILDYLSDGILDLYILVLEYQARSICQLSRNIAVQVGRDTFKVDSWDELVTEINKADTKCLKLSQAIDSSRLTAGFVDVKNGLEEQNKNFSSQREFEDSRLCLECLNTGDYALWKEKNPSPIEGTCKWFLKHPRYQFWTQSNSSLLWVSADPGCGKSVLARFLVENALPAIETKPEPLIAYFFFKDDDEYSKSSTHALCAILHQILLNNSDLLSYTIEAYSRMGNALSRGFDALWKLLIEISNDHEVICVIDALDECEEASRLRLLAKLSGFFATPNRKSKLRVILTSRPYSTIDEALFYQSGLDRDKIHLMGENESEVDQISIEIDLVVEAKIEDFRRKRVYKGITDSTHLALQEKIREIPNRTYLWVALVFPELLKKVGESKGRLLELIATLPRSVDEAYEKILGQSLDAEQALKLLHIVASSFRPLTLSEMNIALSIREGNKCIEDVDLRPAQSFSTVVRELCGLFVTIINEKIFFVHQTAKDFLQNPSGINSSRPTTSFWKATLVPGESHDILTSICSWYLQFNVFEDEPLALSSLQHETDPTIIWTVQLQAASSYANWIKSDRGASMISYGLGDGRESTSGAHRYVDASEREIESYLTKHAFLEYAATWWLTHMKLAESFERLTQPTMKLWEAKSKCFRTWFSIHYIQHQTSIPVSLSSTHAQDLSMSGNLAIQALFSKEIAVKLLLENVSGADIDPFDARLALYFAINFGNPAIIKMLVSHVKPNAILHNFETPLAFAMRFLQMATIECLLELGATVTANIMSVALSFSMALPKPTLEHRNAVVTLLLKHVPSLYIQNSFGVDLVSQALYAGLENLEHLYQNWEKKEEFVRPPPDVKHHQSIFYAISTPGVVRREKIIDFLLKNGLEVNTRNSLGQTPLHIAACQPTSALMVRILLKHGSDVFAKDAEGRDVLEYVIEAGVIPTAALLEAHGQGTLADPPLRRPTMSRRPSKQFSQGSSRSDSRSDSQRSGSGHNFRDTSRKKWYDNPKRRPSSLWGVNLLESAINNNNDKLLSWLLDDRARYSRNLDLGEFYPLHLAALRGNQTAVVLLLKRFNSQSISKSGQTVAHVVASTGNVDIMRCLVNEKVDIRTSDCFGRTVIHIAAAHNHLRMLRFLLRSLERTSINVLARNIRGMTALDVAKNSSIDQYMDASSYDKPVVQKLDSKPKGRTRSNNVVDMLTCSVAQRRKMNIFQGAVGPYRLSLSVLRHVHQYDGNVTAPHNSKIRHFKHPRTKKRPVPATVRNLALFNTINEMRNPGQRTARGNYPSKAKSFEVQWKHVLYSSIANEYGPRRNRPRRPVRIHYHRSSNTPSVSTKITVSSLYAKSHLTMSSQGRNNLSIAGGSASSKSVENIRAGRGSDGDLGDWDAGITWSSASWDSIGTWDRAKPANRSRRLRNDQSQQGRRQLQIQRSKINNWRIVKNCLKRWRGIKGKNRK